MIYKNNYEEMEIKSIETIIITPEIAKSFLERNENNRKISLPVVNFYANEMKNGRWRQTHQGIAVDETGKLVDGQQRMSAVVKSGVTIVTTLTIYKGDVPTMFTPIDRGKNRTIYDLTGLNSAHIAIFNFIHGIFYSASLTKLSPADYGYMESQSLIEFDYIKDITGLSVGTTVCAKSKGLEMFWQGYFKAVLIAAIQENIDISSILDLNNTPPKRKEYLDFASWNQNVKSIGGGVGRGFYTISSPFLWSVIKYKKLPNEKDDEMLDKCRTELRKIFKKKYPLVFDK